MPCGGRRLMQGQDLSVERTPDLMKAFDEFVGPPKN
jgi:hypothetical protein